MILNGIWLGLIFVLKLVLELLGLAFGLNPFGDGRTMQHDRRDAGARLPDDHRPLAQRGWLSAGGICFAYKGLVRREMAAGVGGTLAAIAMLVAGPVGGAPAARLCRPACGHLQPDGAGDDQRSATRLDVAADGHLRGSDIANLVAAGRGPLRRAELLRRQLGSRETAAGGGLDRRPEVLRRRRGARHWSAISGGPRQRGRGKSLRGIRPQALRQTAPRDRPLPALLAGQPSAPGPLAVLRPGRSRQATRPRSPPRAATASSRGSRCWPCSPLGLLGPILLLAWLAIRLFTQAAIAFVLLLAAPFALFFPLLGDSGRRAFKTWGVTLLGAVVAKVVYGAFLSLVLLAAAILGATGGATGFLLSAVFMLVGLPQARRAGRLDADRRGQRAARQLHPHGRGRRGRPRGADGRKRHRRPARGASQGRIEPAPGAWRRPRPDGRRPEGVTERSRSRGRRLQARGAWGGAVGEISAPPREGLTQPGHIAVHAAAAAQDEDEAEG